MGHRSIYKVHFAQQGLVARVGAQGIVEGSGGDLKYTSIAFLDRFIEPVKEWIDFSESEANRSEAVGDTDAF